MARAWEVPPRAFPAPLTKDSTLPACPEGELGLWACAFRGPNAGPQAPRGVGRPPSSALPVEGSTPKPDSCLWGPPSRDGCWPSGTLPGTLTLILVSRPTTLAIRQLRADTAPKASSHGLPDPMRRLATTSHGRRAHGGSQKPQGFLPTKSRRETGSTVPARDEPVRGCPSQVTLSLGMSPSCTLGRHTGLGSTPLMVYLRTLWGEV